MFAIWLRVPCQFTTHFPVKEEDEQVKIPLTISAWAQLVKIWNCLEPGHFCNGIILKIGCCVRQLQCGELRECLTFLAKMCWNSCYFWVFVAGNLQVYRARTRVLFLNLSTCVSICEFRSQPYFRQHLRSAYYI